MPTSWPAKEIKTIIHCVQTTVLFIDMSAVVLGLKLWNHGVPESLRNKKRVVKEIAGYHNHYTLRSFTFNRNAGQHSFAALLVNSALRYAEN
jgi:hypothetical protein